jgi:hypothetical protein
MGSSAVAIREESRRSAQLDRYSDRYASDLHQGAAGRRVEAAGIGQVLPAASPARTQETRATPSVAREVALHDLWFALPQQQRVQFGGCFSEMLLRAVRRQNDAT